MGWAMRGLTLNPASYRRLVVEADIGADLSSETDSKAKTTGRKSGTCCCWHFFLWPIRLKEQPVSISLSEWPCAQQQFGNPFNQARCGLLRKW